MSRLKILSLSLIFLFNVSPINADIAFVDTPSVAADWVHFSGPSVAADWIHFSGPSVAADWIYVKDSPSSADYTICFPKGLDTPRNTSQQYTY